ncbi:hypothetical protein C1646_801714 [Rhizophagus diaphanus]|nr:hypothetical protein C1646_801714 [Rhizophagus diaphanus] [Rhizophagus sp. MUCL 43196]
MLKKRFWENDHELIPPVRISKETDKWKRIRCDDNDDETNEDIETLYSNVMQHVRKNYVNLTYQTIVDTMLDIKCCARCIFRFLGIRDYKCYAKSEEVLLKILNRIRSTLQEDSQHPSTNILLSKTQDKPVCTTCFDLIYQADTLECLWPIIESFNSHNFQVKTFNLSITLPSGIIINNHSVKVYIRQKFRERNLTVDLSNVIDLKEPFKYLLGWSIEKELDLNHSFQSPFIISIEYYHGITQQNHLILTRIPSAEFKLKKVRMKGKAVWTGDSRNNIIAALEKVPDSDFISIGNCPPLEEKERWKNYFPILEHSAVYVGGRYIKLSREISQSPWIINGERLAKTSVSECSGEILREKFRCDDYNFVAAGREDVNVRMLGNGRPFYFEIINPRKPFLSQQELDDAQKEINETQKDLIQINNLTMVTERDLVIIKEGEETKRKTYSALIWISKIVTPEIIDKINQYQDKELTINQQTPIRVLQRRAQMIRPKIIYSMKAEALENHFLTMQLQTEAGTYIKEFIHGDLGRTKPSLGDLLDCYADILALDVLEVDLKWPPNNN